MRQRYYHAKERVGANYGVVKKPGKFKQVQVV